MVVHGGLEQVHAGKTVYQVPGNEKHDKGGAAADHNGIDEDTECL